jgi:hypothetical protein
MSKKRATIPQTVKYIEGYLDRLRRECCSEKYQTDPEFSQYIDGQIIAASGILHKINNPDVMQRIRKSRL